MNTRGATNDNRCTQQRGANHGTDRAHDTNDDGTGQIPASTRPLEGDDHPWIEAHPRGAKAIALLRRIAYNLLTLFRSVTQRCDERRRTPWRTLMHCTWPCSPPGSWTWSGSEPVGPLRPSNGQGPAPALIFDIRALDDG